MTFLSAAVFGRIAGLEARGEFAMILATASFVGFVINLGIPNALQVLSSRSLTTNHSFEDLRRAFILTMLSALLIAPLGYYCLPNSVSKLSSLTVILSVAMAGSALLPSHLAARERYIHSAFASALPSLTVGLGTLLLAYAQKMTVTHLIQLNVAGHLLVNSWTLIEIFMSGQQTEKRVNFIKHAKEILSIGIRSHFSTGVAILYQRVDIWWIGFALGPKELGLYSTAILLFRTFMMPVLAQQQILSVKFSKSRQKIERKLPKILLINICYSIAVSIGILFLGERLIELFFGSEFAPAHRSLSLFIPGLIGFAVSIPAAAIFKSLGYPIQNIAVEIITLILILISLPIGMSFYGLSGATLSVSVSYLIGAVLYIWYLKSALNPKFENA